MDNAYFAYDHCYCEDCYVNTFASCERCGESYCQEDLYHVTMKNGDIVQLCEYCADQSEDIAKCGWCGEYLDKASAIPVVTFVKKAFPGSLCTFLAPGIDYLCGNCQDNDTYDCIECGMKTTEEDLCPLCKEVYGKPEECSRCGEPTLEKDLVHYTENWAECHKCRHECKDTLGLWREVQNDGA
jgi:hypothetical protein